MNGATPIDSILQLAQHSAIATYQWKDRGQAYPGYTKGMAVAYARAYCALKAGNPVAQEIAKADTGDRHRDALAWYSDVFAGLGMANNAPEIDTLRHTYVLLIGLGMRESSGKFCEGRDQGANNIEADTAEAGLFQTSYNARTASPLMPQLFQQYKNSTLLADIFHEGVQCSASNLENFGQGDGAEFQRLTKACPAFAVEFAAVGLRNVRTHWGPINGRQAEVRPECDNLFIQVQTEIENSGLCPFLT